MKRIPSLKTLLVKLIAKEAYWEKRNEGKISFPGRRISWKQRANNPFISGWRCEKWWIARQVNRSPSPPGIVVQLRFPATCLLLHVFYATARNKAAECRFRGCCSPRDHLYRPINFKSRPFQGPRVEVATIYVRYGERRDIPASWPNTLHDRHPLFPPCNFLSLVTKFCDRTTLFASFLLEFFTSFFTKIFCTIRFCIFCSGIFINRFLPVFVYDCTTLFCIPHQILPSCNSFSFLYRFLSKSYYSQILHDILYSLLWNFYKSYFLVQSLCKLIIARLLLLHASSWNLYIIFY